ncbi:uncharacterized protein LOC111718407 [Eurytemora carolleeae]|uniref:uncharacterized protein LOC111718407 n=1 Tax=Eurytemora carolleeae TaxID=1294199 RepID=UPI000C758174|nr:uncharacterized protein LOC111718407 [Eurytemora carolleeae]|eukprot:XP_023349753.1 uncharacterized protein LOC111718407 [Eurytemora affinis]
MFGSESNVVNCSALEPTDLVGPVQMYGSMGHWMTAVYIILVLHVLPVWLAASFTLFRLNSFCPPQLRPSLAWLICIPPAVMSLTATGILLPSSGVFIEILLDIVLCLDTTGYSSMYV